jgi:hypothetical protein
VIPDIPMWVALTLRLALYVAVPVAVWLSPTPAERRLRLRVGAASSPARSAVPTRSNSEPSLLPEATRTPAGPDTPMSGPADRGL